MEDNILQLCVSDAAKPYHLKVCPLVAVLLRPDPTRVSMHGKGKGSDLDKLKLRSVRMVTNHVDIDPGVGPCVQEDVVLLRDN